MGTPEPDPIHAEEEEIADKLISEVDVIKEEPVVGSSIRLGQGAVPRVPARNGKLTSVPLRYKYVADLLYNRSSVDLESATYSLSCTQEFKLYVRIIERFRSIQTSDSPTHSLPD